MEGDGRKVIVIFGAGSGSGKTALAEALLRLLPGWAAVKLTPSGLSTTLAEEGRTPGLPHSDTARLARAGADPVFHLRAAAAAMPEALAAGFSRLPHGRPVLIEGRGALTCLKPDLGILVWRPGLADPKGSLDALAAGADLVFVNGGEADAGPREGLPRLVYGSLAPGGERLGGLPEILRERGLL
jgi:hypothetical protein